MSQSVLVVAAHPDDEVLGVGATIARHASSGDTVHVLILADGESSRAAQGSDTAGAVEARNDAAKAAARILGAQPPRFAGLPDNRLDGQDLLDVVQVIEDAISRTTASIIYTHHGGDLNIDHAVAHRATLTACRPLPGSTVREIYAFETPSSTEWESIEQTGGFRPNHWVEITSSLDRKMAALDAYASEMRPFPHARSREAIEALARLRGCQAGVAAAEAFAVLRSIRLCA